MNNKTMLVIFYFLFCLQSGFAVMFSFVASKTSLSIILAIAYVIGLILFMKIDLGDPKCH